MHINVHTLTRIYMRGGEEREYMYIYQVIHHIQSLTIVQAIASLDPTGWSRKCHTTFNCTWYTQNKFAWTIMFVNDSKTKEYCKWHFFLELARTAWSFKWPIRYIDKYGLKSNLITHHGGTELFLDIENLNINHSHLETWNYWCWKCDEAMFDARVKESKILLI